MTSQQLEERLSSMEQEIAQLKGMITNSPVSAPKPEKWWHKIAGSAANDPTAEAAEQLGREWRRSAE
jgi:cell division septum initiation protein DivIVA